MNPVNPSGQEVLGEGLRPRSLAGIVGSNPTGGMDVCVADIRGRAVYGEGFAADRLLGLRVRIPHGACTFVLCVVSKDKKAKCRTIKTKTQVRIKYKRENNKKNPSHGMDVCVV